MIRNYFLSPVSNDFPAVTAEANHIEKYKIPSVIKLYPRAPLFLFSTNMNP
jgi:hypothetical protein